MSSNHCSACGISGPTQRCTRCKTFLVCSSICWDKVKDTHSSTCAPIDHHIGDEKGSSPNSIIVTGDSVVRSVPDTASITIIIESSLPQTSDSAGAVNNIYEEMIQGEILEQFPELKVEDNSFSINPVIVREAGKKPRTVGWTSTRTVTVTTSELSIVGVVLGRLTRTDGANLVRVGGVNFSLRDDKVAERQALKEATIDAIDKIKVIATAAALSGWSIIKITEDGPSRSRRIHYESSRSFDASPLSSQSTTMTPGVIETRKSVEIVALIT